MEDNVKKTGFLLSLLCFILVGACVFALFSLYTEADDLKTDSSNTSGNNTGTDNPPGNDSGDVETPTTPASFYLENGVGYRTVGNKTSFFIVCKNPEWYKTASDFYKTSWFINVDPKDCVAYKDVTVDIRYSTDKGVTWASLTKVSDETYYEPDDKYNIYALHNIPKDNEIYISYCFVANCKDPQALYEALNENIFDTLCTEEIVVSGNVSDKFSYTVSYYEDFPVYSSNYKKDNVIIPSG